MGVKTPKENQMGAIIDKIKGKAKQIEGRMTGDKVRTAQGTVEKTKGDIEGKVARVKRGVKGKVRRAKAKMKRGARKAKRSTGG